MAKLKSTITAAAILLLGAAATFTSCKKVHNNPFLEAYTTPYEIPPFEQITYDDYLPALDAGIEQMRAQLDSITSNPEAPTFENTILAIENSGQILDRVTMVFAALDESDSSPEMNAIAEEFYPKAQAFSDEMWMNDALFQRVKVLYDNIDTIENPAWRRAVKTYYDRFVRNGALLNDDDKAALAEINGALATLYLQFNKNLLSSTNELANTVQVTDSARLAGLPAPTIEAAAAEAAARELPEGTWVFTLQAPSRLAVLQYADDRDMRQEMYQKYMKLGTTGDFDNRPVINKILQLRAKKAHILGFDNFGSYMTDNVMAKTVDAANALLLQIWEPAKARVAEEVVEMQAYVDADPATDFKIEPWDYYYYAEKVRQQKYDFDENKVREYFPLDAVRQGIFAMADSLYHITFTEMSDAPKYNPEVTVYDVTDSRTGEHVAVFMTDYFPRASKRQGAWMSEFKGSWQDADGTWSRPVIFNVGNFTRPTADAPALLTLDEVETMFHEFGHGLHGMLSRVPLRSQAGTNVDRDFVELPSQIHEHWAFDPQVLRLYARHYKTGEVIPDELIAKLEASSTHNQGFTTAELAGAAMLDLAYGQLNPEADIDIDAFEADFASKIGMPGELTFRYRSPYFKHIFGSDGYASGYYTYLWAEVLDADGFDLFRQNGIFDPETAAKFKHLLESGDSADPMELYVEFRGQQPTVDALLRNRGLK